MNFDTSLIRLSSERLVGIEIEMDSGSSEYRPPVGLTDWQAQPDGSLRNGAEWVLTPAKPFNSVLPAIQRFDAAVTAARTNMETRGSMHVHVQTPDLTPEQATFLCRLYTHFQREIDMLVAPSRRSGSSMYCKSHPINMTVLEWKRLFNWSYMTTNRVKRGERYWTVNCQPMSVINPSLRSVEFRQAGPSRKSCNIYGWVSFCVALVEIASNYSGNGESSIRDYTLPAPALKDFIDSKLPFSGVSEWVTWRTNYINQPATPELIEKALAVLTRPHGIHHVSRQLNIPLPVAKTVCSAAVAAGKARLLSCGKRYESTVPSSSLLAEENALMKSDLAARRRPRVRRAAASQVETV